MSHLWNRPANRYRPDIERRTQLLSVAVALGFVALLVRAIDLHWWKADELAEKARTQQDHQYRIEAARGAILDRQGRILARSMEAPSVGAIARKIPAERIAELAQVLALDEAMLRQRIQTHKGFIWLKRQTTPAVEAQLAALDIPGIRIEKEWRRYYPLGPETGHVLGFVGVDNHGLEGVEHSFDRVLTGESGLRVIRRDAQGRALPGASWLRQPRPGEPLQLTLDAGVQSIAYAALADGIEKHQAQSGSVVVMQPKTGDVLAMVSWPGFNPNNFHQFSPEQWRNRALTDVFEPGSVMKPFTVASALESGKWQANSRIFCENGNFKVGRFVIHDAHPMGWETLKTVLAHSSNIGAAKVALSLGADRLYDELVKFGFGQRTGLEIEGEATGILADSHRWGRVETANIAFGQGVAVTTMQLAAAFSALANHGVYVAPHLLHAQAKPERHRVLSTETSAILEDMLRTASSREGTGRRAVPHGYSVAGKTGTAQRADAHGKYSEHHYTSVFAGYVPVADPQLVIVVVIDEPQGVYYGGLVAAPVFRHIAEAALPYLGVLPDDTPVFPMQPAVVQAAITNSPDLASRGMNFIGLSLREAYRLAASKGLELHTHGRGWVTRQDPMYPDQLSGQRMVEVWLNE